MVVTSAMTMASLGRSTNTEDNMALTPACDWLNWRCPDLSPWANTLQPLDDHQLATRQPLVDDDVGAAFTTRLNPFNSGLVVFDDEDIDALLIGDQRALRDDDLLVWLAAFKGHADELAIHQCRVRIGKGRAQHHGVSGAVHGHVNEVDLSGLIVDRVISETQPNLDIADVALTPARAF